MRLRTLTVKLIGLLMSVVAQASPYLPSSGAQVLERLPTRNDPTQRALAKLRTQLKVAPANVIVAVDLARQYIILARNDADPRYLGYAQAALSPWWDQPNPLPSDVLVLRATILQSTHHFHQALVDLDQLLSTDKSNSQAWLTRATVLQVQGEFGEAQKSCAHLFGIAPELVIRTCMASVANLSGSARPSYIALRSALQSSRSNDPSIQGWVLTLLAEMAQRLDDKADADKHFRDALELSPDDTYLQGAYADFLLDQQRYAEVITMLKSKTRADGLLLRYALALNAAQSPTVAPFITVLRDRFAAAMQRADTVHQREQSRFELQLMKNPKRALQLAQKNWQVQKEPADARIYLEAALGAQDKAAAQPVLAWLKQTGMQDAALTKLKNALEKLS